MQILNEKYKENFSNNLNGLFEKDKWNEARELLEKEIIIFPQEYFLITSLAKVCYNTEHFEDSLEYATQAMKIEPNDALVIYDYACALSALEKNEEAIRQWNKIINMDINKIAYGDYGEGMKWAKSIVNDSRYRIALSHVELQNIKEAKRLINEHLQYRQRGIYSDFTKKQVVNKQKDLT